MYPKLYIVVALAPITGASGLVILMSKSSSLQAAISLVGDAILNSTSLPDIGSHIFVVATLTGEAGLLTSIVRKLISYCPPPNIVHDAA
jgi:hypothetical protein